MATDNFKRVLWNDGEGITHGDLNDMQTFTQAHIGDQIIQGLIGNVTLLSAGTDAPEHGGRNGANAPNHLAYCLHGGSAYPRQGTGPENLQIAPGTLFQKVGTTDGSTPTLLFYTFAGTEEVTLAAGHATHPRVDLLQMKLELVNADSQTRDFKDGTTGAVTSTSMNIKKRVQCTLSVKQGTPAASPTYPDPDAGYVAVAGVVVGANWLTSTQLVFGNDMAGAEAVVHDLRMPVNVQGYNSDISTAKVHANWAAIAGAGALGMQTNNSSNDLRFLCPKGGRVSRIVGVEFLFEGETVAAEDIHLYSSLTNDGTLPVKRNNITDITGVTSPEARLLSFYSLFEANHNPSAGPVVQPSATNKIGPPLWTSGFRCAVPGDESPGGFVYNACVGIRFQVQHTPSKVSYVTWYVAQGL